MKRFFCAGRAAALLAAAVLLGSAPAYAAGRQITGVQEDFCDSGVYVNGAKSLVYESIRDLEFLYDVQPGTVFFLPLTGGDFYWEGDGQGFSQELLARQGVSVSCEAVNEDGTPIIGSADIAELDGMTGISIRFADTLLTAGAAPFELYGRLDTASSSEAFTLKGTLRNRRVIVAESTYPIRLGAGRMGMAYESHASLEFNLGGNMILRAPVTAYDELIGVAAERSVPSDITSAYPAVEKLYALEALNLKGTVSFDLEGQWYVYGGGMAYLGTSGEQLPQQSRYYLSREKL
jgi:hypothetical protein